MDSLYVRYSNFNNLYKKKMLNRYSYLRSVSIRSRVLCSRIRYNNNVDIRLLVNRYNTLAIRFNVIINRHRYVYRSCLYPIQLIHVYNKLYIHGKHITISSVSNMIYIMNSSKFISMIQCINKDFKILRRCNSYIRVISLSHNIQVVELIESMYMSNRSISSNIEICNCMLIKINNKIKRSEYIRSRLYGIRSDILIIYDMLCRDNSYESSHVCIDIPDILYATNIYIDTLECIISQRSYMITVVNDLIRYLNKYIYTMNASDG